jgi:hypothetical protein
MRVLDVRRLILYHFLSSSVNLYLFQLSLDRSQYSRVYIIIDSGSYLRVKFHINIFEQRKDFRPFQMKKKHFLAARLIDNQTILCGFNDIWRVCHTVHLV